MSLDLWSLATIGTQESVQSVVNKLTQPKIRVIRALDLWSLATIGTQEIRGKKILTKLVSNNNHRKRLAITASLVS